jgi:hypothetical protein
MSHVPTTVPRRPAGAKPAAVTPPRGLAGQGGGSGGGSGMPLKSNTAALPPRPAGAFTFSQVGSSSSSSSAATPLTPGGAAPPATSAVKRPLQPTVAVAEPVQPRPGSASAVGREKAKNMERSLEELRARLNQDREAKGLAAMSGGSRPGSSAASSKPTTPAEGAAQQPRVSAEAAKIIDRINRFEIGDVEARVTNAPSAFDSSAEAPAIDDLPERIGGPTATSSSGVDTTTAPPRKVSAASHGCGSDTADVAPGDRVVVTGTAASSSKQRRPIIKETETGAYLMESEVRVRQPGDAPYTAPTRTTISPSERRASSGGHAHESVESHGISVGTSDSHYERRSVIESIPASTKVKPGFTAALAKLGRLASGSGLYFDQLAELAQQQQQLQQPATS